MTDTSPHRDPALSAGLELLTERGFAALTMDQVAMRAAVHPSSVYERWRSRSEFVAELLREYGAQPADLPDSGDLRSDLTIVLDRLVRTVQDLRVVIATAISEAAHDDELCAELRLFVFSWQSQLRELLGRAVEREQLRDSLDEQWALDQASSLVYFRALLTLDLSATTVESLAEQIVRAWRTARPG